METKDIVISALGMALIGVIAFNLGSSSDKSELTENPTTTKIVSIDKNLPSKKVKNLQNNSADQLVGNWVQAKSGGEDGQTVCADAETMTTFNGGTTVTYEINRDETIRYVLWYDNSFGQSGGPTVNATYNEGRWTLKDKTLSISWAGSETKPLYMGQHDATHTIEIDGNVLRMSPDDEQETSDRFVRCI